jgi:hypothetical protein
MNKHVNTTRNKHIDTAPAIGIYSRHRSSIDVYNNDVGKRFMK